MTVVSTLRAAVHLSERVGEQVALERLVDVTTALTGATYGAALLRGPDGSACALAHRGMAAADVAKLPHLPRPLGLIEVVRRGEVVRLDDLAGHPESAGFPTGHVPMAGLLGIPISVDGRVLGELYLTRSPGRGGFTAQDEQAAAAAAGLTGAALSATRQRSAHEDLLDRLGATDTRSTDSAVPGEPSPAIRRLLTAARQVLGMDLAFLSRLHDGAQTFTHVDTGRGAPGDAARPAVLGLAEGDTIDAAGGYCTLLVEGQIPAAVPDVAAHPTLGPMEVTAALQVGGYCGVPVHLPEGTLYGTLCGLDSKAGPCPTVAQLETMRILADLIGVRLQRELDSERDRREQAEAMRPYRDGTRRQTVLQPIVDLRTGVPTGYEALSRFWEAGGAARRPDSVFAEAYALGVGVRLEQAAARDALALLGDLPDGAYLSVNLSPRALLDPATVDLLSGALAGGGAGRLVLELTEHEHVPDYAALLRQLAGLRERGLRLAVDDTGSGFASLQHVTRLRPDIVKLDIAFVRDVHLDPSRRAVARALIAFAGDVGAVLVAEGIETAAEREELLRLGAAYGQGYHLGRPRPPGQLDRGGAGPGAAATCHRGTHDRQSPAGP